MHTQAIDDKFQIFDLLGQHQKAIYDFGAARLGLFGSFARGDQTIDSDIDLLIEFQDGKKTYKNLAHLSYYLQELVDRKVQLVTWMSLADFVKREVEKEIEYVAIAH